MLSGVLRLLGIARPPRLPLVRPEDIEPVGEPMTARDARKVYRQIHTGGVIHGTREEVGEAAEEFAESLKMEEEDLRDAVTSDREDVRETGRRLKALRARPAGSCDGETGGTVEDLEDELSADKKALREAEAALAAFRADKRPFLIDYLNNEIRQFNEANGYPDTD